MSDLADHDPPYWLVQTPQCGGKHIGPFSSYLDVALASQVAAPGWRWGTLFDNAMIMNQTEFKAHLEQRAKT